MLSAPRSVRWGLGCEVSVDKNRKRINKRNLCFDCDIVSHITHETKVFSLGELEAKKRVI